MKSIPIDTLKINLYLDKFIKGMSLMTPSACQKDLSESNFHILTFGICVPKTTKFCLPSSYLAFTVFPEDIQIDVSGKQWINNHKWKPATDNFSPIEVFPYNNALALANFRSDRTLSSPVFPSHPDT